MAQSTVEHARKDVVEVAEEAPIRVLHVDDEASFLKVAKPILEMQGNFHVETANSVEEALDKMKEKRYDAIVSDYVMPERSGLDFLKELRDNGNNLPFIIFTGKGREEMAIKALNLGADRYFNKIGNPETVYGELAHGVRTTVKARWAEEEQARTETKYQSLVENTGAGILTVDVEGKFAFVNRALCSILGYSEKELLGTPFVNLIHPDDKSRMLQIFRGFMANPKEKLDFEFKAVHKKGYIVHLHSSPTIFKYKNAIIGSHAIVTDITERKKAEEELMISEEKWRSLAENVLDYIAIIDRDGEILFINRTTLGFDEKEVVGSSIYDYTPQEHSSILKKKIEQVFGNRKSARLEVKGVGMKGTGFTRWYEDSIAPIARNGRVDKALFIIRDITERKMIEERTRASEEKYRLLFEQSPIGVGLSALDGSVIATNEALENILGYSKKELHKMKAAEIYGDAEQREELLGILNQHGVVKNFGATLKRKDGTTFDALLNMVQVNMAGEVVLQTTCQDISKRRLAEKNLAHERDLIQTLLGHHPDFIYFKDNEARFHRVSKHFCEFFGRSEGEIIGKTDLELFPEEIAKETYNEDLQVIKTGKPIINKEESAAGTWVLTSKMPWVDKEGNVIGLFGISRDITERKKVEDSLRESEEKYRSIVELAPDGITTIDLKGVITSVNPTFLKLTGFSRNEVVGKHFTKIGTIRARDIPRYLKLMSSALKGKLPSKFEFSYVRKDGTNGWAEGHFAVLKRNGKTIGFQGILREVTEHKKAQKALDESEERYKTLIEETPVGILNINFKGKITYINKKIEEIIGYSREELLNKNALAVAREHDIVTDKVLNLAAKRMKGKFLGKDMGPLRVKLKRRDGNQIWVEAETKLLKRFGFPVGLQAIVRDITESKEMNERLRESEERLRQLVENAPDAIYTNDLKGNFLDGNKQAEELIGYKREDLIGKNMLRIGLVPKRQIPRIMKALLKNVRGQKSGPIELELTRMDGTKVTVEATSIPVKRKGKTEVIGIARDVTERKKAEEKLRTMNEKLGVVGKLTRHDARNRLSAVTMNAFLAKQKLPSDNEALGHLKEIETACGQVEKIFDFARIYEKLGVEELVHLDVEKTFKQAAMLFSELSNIVVTNNCQGLTLLADSLLRQLFYNLIDNSLRHGEKISQIRLYYEEASKDTLKLVFEDDGIGISKREKEKIFREGYGKGSGYGLYLIRKMCEVYGWNIQETGKQGKGARFTITIPKESKDKRENYRLR